MNRGYYGCAYYSLFFIMQKSVRNAVEKGKPPDLLFGVATWKLLVPVATERI